METDDLIKALGADAGRPAIFARPRAGRRGSAGDRRRCRNRLCRHHRPAPGHRRGGRNRRASCSSSWWRRCLPRPRFAALVRAVAAASGEPRAASRCWPPRRCFLLAAVALELAVVPSADWGSARWSAPTASTCLVAHPVDGHRPAGAVRRRASPRRAVAVRHWPARSPGLPPAASPPPSTPPTAPTICRCSWRPGTRSPSRSSPSRARFAGRAFARW